MSSFESLNALREQNKNLLKRLQEHTEKLKSLCPRKTPNTTTVHGTDERMQQRNPPAEKNNEDVITDVVIPSHPVHARVALSKLQTQEPSPSRTSIIDSVSSGEACKTSTPFLNDSQQQQPDQAEEEPVYSRLLRDYGNIRQTGSRENITLKSILRQDSLRREAGRVTFQPLGEDRSLTPDRHRVQPLLGYDWIAGLLDAQDSSLTERSEQFFSELRNFRQVNKDECVHSQSSGLSNAETAISPLKVDEGELQSKADSHQCTFCYRINNRLFATPLDPQVGCPVCKMPKSNHPHTVSEPAFIRVSIPRSTLLPAYRYKAHRRCSFDPSDSLGLPSHCLSGWSNAPPSTIPHMSSLDLRSSMASAADSSANADALLDESVLKGRSSDDLLDMSRLARYRFQHLPQSRCKLRTSCYPVY
ncbi:migration and invasion-inhibitory protein [Alosa sapidissima]|uniref:migration and invasion-inhibitory protein n=1 Tax=Alosa sapidissima TaxID=34773 RepID=UPI001C09C813|nr:migration and invasion-inhibitory protein [Alosa sapidissima]